jgi:hypothetical protein
MDDTNDKQHKGLTDAQADTLAVVVIISCIVAGIVFFLAGAPH